MSEPVVMIETLHEVTHFGKTYRWFRRPDHTLTMLPAPTLDETIAAQLHTYGITPADFEAVRRYYDKTGAP